MNKLTMITCIVAIIIPMLCHTSHATEDYIQKDNGAGGVEDSIVYEEIYLGTRIGIGTSNPDNHYTLEVDGRLKVEGLRTITKTTVPNVVGGNDANTVGDYVDGGTIGGGGGTSTNNNEIDDSSDYATISGGYNNFVSSSATYSTIGGGGNNLIGTGGDSYAVISGGSNNTAEHDYVSIGGGYSNSASGVYSTIAGGFNNDATSGYAFVGSGTNNDATGDYSVVSGGYYNTASGNTSWAGGYYGTASYTKSFTWSGDTGCSATTSNQFMVCASNGAYFTHNVSALSYTDRTPYPENLEVAYEAVTSMTRLPDGEYDPYNESSQLDHSSLSSFVLSEQADGTLGRNLSATVSAQNEVIKDLIARVNELESMVSTLSEACAR